MNDDDDTSGSDYSRVTSPGLSSKGSGMTQLIRQKLKFTDEGLWKRFSARRLELIDVLALSEKKASEQDSSIRQVANQLRTEYGYPEDTLPDFEKLLRAGIQSVRRNRKRVPKSKITTPGQTYHYYNNSSGTRRHHHHNSQQQQQQQLQRQELKREPSIEDDEMPDAPLSPPPPPHAPAAISRTIMSISALVENGGGGGGERNNSSSHGSNHRAHEDSPGSSFYNIRFKQRVEPSEAVHLDKYSLSIQSIGAGTAYKLLGQSVLETSALNAIISRCDNNSHRSDSGVSGSKFSATINDPGALKDELLRETRLRDVAREVCPMTLASAAEHMIVPTLYIKAALCSLDRGYDWVVSLFTAIFGEVIDALSAATDLSSSSTQSQEQREQQQQQQTVRLPPVTSLPSPVPSAATSVCSVSLGDSVPRVVPVTLRFFTQKLDFTYSPISSTPPTVMEILENGRAAFKIVADDKVLKIRDLNTGRIVESDADLERIYATRHIDLELYYPTTRNHQSSIFSQQQHHQKQPHDSSQPSSSMSPPKFLLPSLKLPPPKPTVISRPRFQELL